MRDVANELRRWLSENLINRDDVCVTITFPTERDAAAAAFYVKREFESSFMAPDFRTAGFWKFKAFGIDFEFLSKETKS
jgi:hypothetical protein